MWIASSIFSATNSGGSAGKGGLSSVLSSEVLCLIVSCSKAVSVMYGYTTLTVMLSSFNSSRAVTLTGSVKVICYNISMKHLFLTSSVHAVAHDIAKRLDLSSRNKLVLNTTLRKRRLPRVIFES